MRRYVKLMNEKEIILNIYQRSVIAENLIKKVVKKMHTLSTSSRRLETVFL